jgi:hypothetical protein
MGIFRRTTRRLQQIYRQFASGRRGRAPGAADFDIVVEPSQSLYGDLVEISFDRFNALADRVIEVPEGMKTKAGTVLRMGTSIRVMAALASAVTKKMGSPF